VFARIFLHGMRMFSGHLFRNGRLAAFQQPNMYRQRECMATCMLTTALLG
jgi:hypothetical protein